MKTEREKMTNAEPFLTNDPQLMEDKKKARILCSRFNESTEDEVVRKAMLKELLGSCTENIAVKPPFHCDYGYNIFVGDDYFMNFDCVFLDAAPIRIGKHCMIADGHVRLPGHHQRSDRNRCALCPGTGLYRPGKRNSQPAKEKRFLPERRRKDRPSQLAAGKTLR